MPVGLTTSQYIKYLSASIVCMFIGSQAVHLVYKPLDNLEHLVELEKEKLVKSIEEEESKKKKN